MYNQITSFLALKPGEIEKHKISSNRGPGNSHFKGLSQAVHSVKRLITVNLSVTSSLMKLPSVACLYISMCLFISRLVRGVTLVFSHQVYKTAYLVRTAVIHLLHIFYELLPELSKIVGLNPIRESSPEWTLGNTRATISHIKTLSEDYERLVF